LIADDTHIQLGTQMPIKTAGGVHSIIQADVFALPLLRFRPGFIAWQKRGLT
jgi:hypothetical protein